LNPGQTTAISPFISLRNGPPPSAIFPAGYNDVSTALISLRNGPPPSAILPDGYNNINTALISLRNGPPPSALLQDGFNDVTTALILIRNGADPSAVLPPGYNDVTTSLVSIRNGPALSHLLPAGSNDITSALISLRNGQATGVALPTGANDISSALISLRNGMAGGPAAGRSETFALVALKNGPLAGPLSIPASTGLSRVLVSDEIDGVVGATSAARESNSAVAGEALRFRYTPSRADVTRVEFLLDGASLGEVAESPFETVFVMPEGVSSLQVRAIGKSADGKALSAAEQMVYVIRSESKDIEAAIVGRHAQAVAGRQVEIVRPGLAAEIFEADRPLTEMPPLEGRVPHRRTSVSALNYRNPEGVFGPDPFGTGLSPDFAIRFSGDIRIPEDGDYRFRLWSHQGARLSVNGIIVAEVPGGNSESRTGNGTISLKAGVHAILVDYFATVGAPELDLAFAKGEAPLRPVPASSLTHREQLPVGPNGNIVLRGVPGWAPASRPLDSNLSILTKEK